MPYKIVGNKVVKRYGGKTTVVGKSKNPKKYLQKLNMVEHKVKGKF